MNIFAHRIARLAPALLLGVAATVATYAGAPDFLKEGLYSPGAAPVAKALPTLAADVVILDGGLEQGLARGMLCRVRRGLEEIGEIIIIESTSNRSAGLILELAGGAFIQEGDIAHIIRTLQDS